VSCGFSRETLALHLEGDLPEATAARTAGHLAACGECRQFVEAMRASQLLLKSMRGETVDRSDCTAMRREVMAMIADQRRVLGWALRIERAIALGLRPSYAMAAAVLIGVLSISVLAQLRPDAARGTMERPDGYRGWTVIADRVYIEPSSLREFEKTRTFPDGTVLVWEQNSPATGGPHPASSTLLVSVKDSTKFEGGWGFFDFSGTRGVASRKAEVLPESSGCRTCHRQGAVTEIRQLPANRA
jgi:hypothetical protein